MGLGSAWHWIIIILLALVLFGGKGRITSIMGDFASGIKAFRKGMTADDDKKLDNKGSMVDVTPAKDAEKSGRP
jgi:sec-independent protein translocase protein TatA